MVLKYIFCVIVLLKSVQPQEWDLPAFFPNDEELDKVEFDENVDPNLQVIRMEENIHYDITIAFLNYKGNEPPSITRFMEPTSHSNSTLGAIFKRTENGYWALIITITQDFEYQNFCRYAFEIVAADVKRTIYLHIKNIDDEIPYIRLGQTTCAIKENYLGIPDCFYAVTDADGVINGVMKYRITGPAGVDKIFEFKGDNLSNGLKEWEVHLNVLKELDYEATQFYLLDFEVEDSGGNIGMANILIQVIDLPDQPPVWTKIFCLQKIREKESWVFEVEAVDGDVGLNFEINYKLESEWPDLFSIDSKSGVIRINPIDRDTLQQEFFTFKVTAFERLNPTSKIVQNVEIIVEDINDNLPEILSIDGILIPENSVGIVVDIEINDRDSGKNAVYEVSIADDHYNRVFAVVPSRGYQNSSFSLLVIDHTFLDYETGEWWQHPVVIKATDPDYENSKFIYVMLENLNDEIPIFDQDEYTVAISEINIAAGSTVIQVMALDKDVDDVVRYSLIVNPNDMFNISSHDGIVYTKRDNVFDYEKQKVVEFVVQAEDSLNDIHHKVTVPVTVFVVDVNDESPQISMPAGSITVPENRKEGTLLNGDFEITAIDEDTTAHLIFSVDWDASYAVKNGMQVSSDHFRGCVKVETNYKNGTAKALLQLHEIKLGNTPDYELFDTLNIALIVQDLNQEVGLDTDKAIITIYIEDINDNKPKFDSGTITSIKSVIEHAAQGTLIDRIIATDADGPSHNNIVYSLRPTSFSDWVTIDALSGNLFVNSSKIDADIPVRNLKYIVEANDGSEYETTAEITINVIDINDNYPEIRRFEDFKIIPEKSKTGTLIKIIEVTDKDRDTPFNKPWFGFSECATDEVKNFFSISLYTGEVHVHYKDDNMLDRDFGTQQFVIPFIIGDNFEREGASGQQNIQEYWFTVTLSDINDQAPLILTKELHTTENLKTGETVGIVEAVDHDEPETLNSAIKFSILEIQKGESAVLEPPADLFSISTDDDFSGKGTLVTAYDLKGYYGTYQVKIKANDLGVPTQSAVTIVEVIIEKYNFLPPQIVYPLDGAVIYLSKTQSLNEPLITFDGTALESFIATDSQDDKWDLRFEIKTEMDFNDVFTLVQAGQNRVNLQLKLFPDYEQVYKLKIVAYCNCQGDGPFTDVIAIEIKFLKEEQPIFGINTIAQQFTENSTGIGTFKLLPEAQYENESWEHVPIYYFLTEDTSGSFVINKYKPELKLEKMLDREEQDVHMLTVVASNRIGGIGNSVPQQESKLTVLIQVIDVNDNPPNFDQSNYYAYITPSDKLFKVIRQVTATDLDSNDKLQYWIVKESLRADGQGISDIQNPFYIATDNGDLHLNFTVESDMSGYFTFDVKVTDEVKHQDTALVTIYILTDESKRIKFQFENDIRAITSKQKEIEELLENKFGFKCKAEIIEKQTNGDKPIINVTDVIVYLFGPNTNGVLDNKLKTYSGNDLSFTNLRVLFLEIGLQLLSSTDSSYTQRNM